MGKALEKQTKTIKDQGKKQTDALVALKPKEIKPKKTKPNEYGDFIRESYEPVQFFLM